MATAGENSAQKTIDGVERLAKSGLKPGNPGNSGGKKGRSGRRPDWLKEKCRAVLARKATWKRIDAELKDGTDADVQRLRAWLADRAEGKAAETVDVNLSGRPELRLTLIDASDVAAVRRR